MISSAILCLREEGATVSVSPQDHKTRPSQKLKTTHAILVTCDPLNKLRSLPLKCHPFRAYERRRTGERMHACLLLLNRD